MPLLSIKASKKIETTVRLEESTAKLVDQYAHFVQGSADDVVNQALDYVFTKDKDFQQHLTDNPTVKVPSALRVKKAPGVANGAGKGKPAASVVSK
jgi:hypothetical protein